MWVAHIPAISDRTGVSHEQLGGLLLLLGGAAFVGMQVCGPLLDRWGSRPTTVVAAVALGPAIVAPALASSPVQLGAALIAFGFANGSLDVSMNAQAVVVEQEYRRPIMSAFHGWFSVGGLIGSGVVALTLSLHTGVVTTTIAAAIAGAVVLAVVAPGLMPPEDTATATVPGAGDPATDPVVGVDAPGPVRWWHGVDLRRMTILAVVAFSLMLAEGTAYDWSALHLVETYGVDQSVGAIAFGAFSAAMVIARFVVDPIAATIGPASVLRYGALLGLAGMLVAIAAPNPGLAVAGWVVFGLGLAGLIPQIFTAAGNLSAGASGRTISLVVGCGYLGMLAGPAVVGFIGGRTTLATGLLAAVVALVIAVLAAGVVRPRPQ